MTAPLNLASQPLRNERLPALLLSLAAVALVGITVRHAFVVWTLLPSRTSALHREVEAQDAEVARLRTEVATLRAPKPDPAAVKQWALVKGLVDRRAFSWTDLFDRLEEVLPPGVRLLSVAPTVRDGDLRLELQALARSGEDALQFLGVLQQRRVRLLQVPDQRRFDVVGFSNENPLPGIRQPVDSRQRRRVLPHRSK